VDSLAFAQIENFHAVVAKRADEQSFTRRIERKMIDPTFDSREWDRLLEFKTVLLGVGSNDATARRDQKSATKEKEVHSLP
jgi:hypothetical protein